MPSPPTTAPPLRSRIAAASALTSAGGAALVFIVLVVRDFGYVLVSAAAVAIAIALLSVASTRRRFRFLAGAGAVAFAGLAIAALVLTGREALWLLLAIAAVAIAAASGVLALRWEIDKQLAARWHQVPATHHGVLFINPKAGDGKPERMHLDREARRRSIEPVLLERGDDLRQLAEAAVARGADALGMAGGDGSQAVVAAVAAAHALPFVCIPAGTRNHFALDIGVDRADPVRALDAFGPAKETAIDLGAVNGEVFVNNVSLGVYAHFVSSKTYREAKRKTVAEMLPKLLGPDAPPSGLRVDCKGEPITDVQVVLVSNNPYTLASVVGFGSRARLDTGALGVATLSINRASDVDVLIAMEAAGHPERFNGWRQWTTPTLEVDGPPQLAAAADGESYTWKSPLRFTIKPRALRVRIGRDQPGASPALLHTPLTMSTIVGLARVVAGRPSGIVITEPQVTHDRS